MDANPQVPVGAILEQVDVVVSAAHRAELRGGLLQHGALLRDRALGDRLEHRMVVDALPVRAPDAERDDLPDLVHDARHIHVGSARVRADGAVAARDVVADAVR